MNFEPGDRIYRFFRGNTGTIVWVSYHTSHVGIRWDSSGEIYGYDIRYDRITKFTPLELLAEQDETW